MDGPGTQRSDGEAVSMDEAVATWAAVARPTLERVAGEYGSFITYQQLSDELQASTGITTRTLMHHWIGKVLGVVSDGQRGTDEPLLSSLVVKASQEIGPGYAKAVTGHTGAAPDDVEVHAAAERLACYRHFGADVPDDAVPALTPDVAAARMAVRVAAKAAGPKPVCQQCFMQLPLTGVCGTCDLP